MRLAAKMTVISALFLVFSGCGGGASSSPEAGMAADYAAGGDYGGEALGAEAAEPPPAPVATGGEASAAEAEAGAVAGPSDDAIAASDGGADEAAIAVSEEPDHGPLLTAASVGDADRRDNYLGYLGRHPVEARRIQLDMTRRARIRVVDTHGRPVNDARIDAYVGRHQSIGHTHADGIWDFYPGVHGAPSGRARLRVTHGQSSTTAQLDLPATGDAQDVVVRLDTTAVGPQALDLAFAIDVTGSMEDELRYVNAEIGTIVQRIRRAAPETNVRVAAVFYRDRSDREVVSKIDFTTDVAGFARSMRAVRASGGGDYPEDMNTGLRVALEDLSWTAGNASRVLVVIADAPPKEYADARYRYRDAMLDAAGRGIRIVPVAASGADRTVEYLFRAMGAFTSTPYVYLTDDSGIGNAHMEADTDVVAVEYLADLLTRMVVSDLQGEGMHEPGMFTPDAPLSVAR